MAPPSTTATDRLGSDAHRSARGAVRPAKGSTATAAPRYRSPARVNAPMSSVSRDAAGAEMPNRIAATPHRTFPLFVASPPPTFAAQLPYRTGASLLAPSARHHARQSARRSFDTGNGEGPALKVRPTGGSR